jgi:hypothetical protein
MYNIYLSVEMNATTSVDSSASLSNPYTYWEDRPRITQRLVLEMYVDKFIWSDGNIAFNNSFWDFDIATSGHAVTKNGVKRLNIGSLIKIWPYLAVDPCLWDVSEALLRRSTPCSWRSWAPCSDLSLSLPG